MDFGDVLTALKSGGKVRRAGWNGKGMWLALVSKWTWDWPWDGYKGTFPYTDLPDDLRVAPFIAMKTADNKVVPWLASQTDMLADDWEIVG